MKKYLKLLVIPTLFMISCTGGETPSNEVSSLNEVISENISINSIVTSLDEFVSEEESLEVSIEESQEEIISSENSLEVSSESISSVEDVIISKIISSESNNSDVVSNIMNTGGEYKDSGSWGVIH